MDETSRIITAFSEIYREFGEPAEPYININALWNRPGVLEQWRNQLEKHISNEYLPGFHFESEKHFLWHFNVRDDPFIILRGRSPQTHLETWLRSIMVPRSLHYRSEVAHALYRWEAKYRPRLERRNKWNQSWSWTNRVQRVFDIASDESGYEPLTCASIRSIQRWKYTAASMRQERLESSTPSGWCIDCIELDDDLEIRHDFEYAHFDVPRHLQAPVFYRETWIWKPIDGHNEPRCTSITFGKPATCDLWKKRWKDKQAKA